MITTASVLQASALIEERTGLAASVQFRGDLGAVLQSLSNGDVGHFIHELQTSPETTSPAWQKLINALTIGETYFLRDQGHFQMLRTVILPEIIARRRQQGRLTLNIWSVGCATGEEPYSIAVTLYETLPDLADWTVRLIGTDLNAYALNNARHGVYRQWAFRTAGEEFQKRYFDTSYEGLRIKPHIQEMVTFRHANLLAGPPLPQLDLILCRNVLLYFGAAFASHAEDLLFDGLAPGGWLVLGPAEAPHHRRDRWVTHLFPGTTLYQKPLTRPQHTPVVKQHKAPPGTGPLPDLDAGHDDAVRAIHEEDYELAAALLVNVLQKDPDNAPAYTLMAFVLANRHLLKEAHAHLDTAIRLEPLLADAHYLRALLYMEEGSADKATKALRATLYCQRNHPLASFLLGNIQAQRGEFPRAVRHWENARHALANLKPDSPLSNLSPITAGHLDTLIEEQLAGWHG